MPSYSGSMLRIMPSYSSSVRSIVPGTLSSVCRIVARIFHILPNCLSTCCAQ